MLLKILGCILVLLPFLAVFAWTDKEARWEVIALIALAGGLTVLTLGCIFGGIYLILGGL